ncbi:DUF4245 family protein [Nocardioides sp.]|uniref:DUF4245 family protein n=1 Tax=Nocardioides sp. TaxID=35761 RepID=UPI002C0A8C0C|nr:DUF4245 family protein [Nocardioides sp.]HSX68471.1 DUF4245 family protein [Nocardioides sp.]
MAQGSARYERSAAGMVGAMIVTLLVILAFVAFRALNRDDLQVEPRSVDYLEVVAGLQANDLDPAYPPQLPKGWQATRAVYDPDNLAWELDLLTDDERYIGVRQAALRDRDLVEEYVDDEGKPGDITGFDTGVALEWTPWEVDNDDRAYTAPLGMQRGDEPNAELERGKGMALLVFGSASAADFETLIGELVLDPVDTSR